MTALHEAIEYSALGWIKPELDETLRLVGVEVEGFAEDPSDSSRMRVCAELLHQVQGTLRMVELYAPAMVAEEMEQLAIAMQHGQAPDHEGACSALLRGVVLLPDYLERLQSGHKEISIVLLPMLNDLRAARGEVGLSESVLFNPDLDRPLPASVPRATPLSPAARAHEVAPYLMRLRDALQAWPEQGGPEDSEGLRFALEALLARTPEDAPRRMLWVATMVATALRDRAIAQAGGLRQAFASVDRESRGLFQPAGFATPRVDAALEPTRQLLWHVAHSDSDHPALLKLREVFELDALKPTESELDHARGSVAGRNRSLLDTVSAAIKEDLLRVKDELDLYLRTGRNNPAELQPQAERLQSVSDTLGMLGLGLARSLVQQQRDAMQEIVEGRRKADESALLEVAGALLYVDASLDDQVARLASGDGADTEEDLAGAEARKVLDVLVREAITNFASARQAFEAFVETQWSHVELEPVPKLLRDVSGALSILELPVASQYLDGVRQYIEVELLERRRIPNSRHIDTFADAMTSVEYYLEALREQRANRDDILDITRNSLESLGYWPLPAVRPMAAAPVVAAVAPVAPVAPAVESAVAESAVVESVAVASIEAALEAEARAEAETSAVEAPVIDVPAIEMPEASGIETAAIETPAPEVPALAAVPPPAPQKPAAVPFVPLFLPPREPAAPPAPQAAAAEAMPAPAPAPEPAFEPAPVEAAASAPVAPIHAGFDAANDDIDDEIREIFLEEFEEEIGNLAQLLPAWKADPNNIELLQPVRRVFHTLKGSGRLVGAKTLGEFSWKIENMLNKVRDGLRPATPPVIAMVDHAYATLPKLHAALSGDGMLAVDLRAMESFADRIAGGEETMPVFAAVAAAAAPAVVVPAVEEIAAPVAASADEEGIAVSVDPVLFEILQAEVGGHLRTIDGWLERARNAPTPADDPLVRAIHTMNGAFAMSEVPAITDALTPAEAYVRRLLGTAGTADAEAVDAIGQLADRVRATTSALSVSGGRVPRCDALAARFTALRDALPEPSPAPLAEDTHPPVEAAHDHALERPLELTDLDLSAYGHFDAPAAEPAPPAEAAAADGLDLIELGAEAEAELAKLLGQIPGVAAPAVAPPAPEPVAADVDNPERLLALMESYETERLEAERVEAERLAAERAEAARREQELADLLRIEDERLAAERLEAERLEAERLEAERLEAEQREAERLEAERLEAEQREAERLEAERLELERLEAERLEAERLEAQLREQELADLIRIEDERLAAERLEAERLAMQPLEIDQPEAAAFEIEAIELEAFDAGADARLEAELLEAERLIAETGFEAETTSPTESVNAAPAGLEAVAAPAATDEAAAGIAGLLAATAVVDPDEALDMADLDADLVDIFVEEGRDLLDHSDQLLARLRAAPDEREVIVGLQRDLHTLKGGARMAGAMAIGELGHSMESLLEAVAEQRMQLDRQDMPLLETGFDRLHTMVTRIGDRRAVAMPEALIAAFDTRALGQPLIVSTAPAAAPWAAVQEGMTEAPAFEAAAFEGIVFEEAAFEEAALDAPAFESLPAEDTAEAAEPLAFEAMPEETSELAQTDAPAFADFEIEEISLESAPEAAQPPSARILPFAPIERTPVSIEEQAFIDSAFVDEAFAADTSVEEAPVEETFAEAAPADAADSAVAQPETAEEIEAEMPAPVFAPLPGLKPLSAPLEFGGAADDEAGLRGGQEQVRVRAELLDRLVNYAGEVAIYRSRLEQQLGAFRAATAEMEQTNIRLRDQLRRLEIETEAQIIARYQREGESTDGAFDPLELDRFSTVQQLSRALAETAADLTSLQTTLDDLTQQYDTLLLQQSRVSSELQEGLMRTRMVPFDTVVPRLRRVLRQAASDTGKPVQLKIEGAQGELDRNVLERMTAPLEHMLRNAVAHGLEKTSQRTAEGKPQEGTVTIAIRKEGSEVVLQVGDDGRGLDRVAIRERGEARGLVRKDAPLSNAQLDALIFEPGFSTAEEVTRLAGRGVGMDVVASEVRQLGGTIDIHSELGKGTVFTLRLPQTLAVTQAAFVRIGETTYAVPIASVRGVGRIPREELARGATTYRYGNEEYVLHDLGKLIGHAPAKAEGQLQMPLLLTRSGDLHIAVTLDQIVGNREIVVKPIGPQVASIPGIFGATIMGDGSVVVILDIAPLVRRIAVQPEETVEVPAAEQRAVPLVMVVDDSITMRKVTGRVLERNNFEVVTAKDGVDALERMVDRVPDLMLLDIEMPRMDGYELATTMKADARLAKVPIIMITSRTGDKHRQRAMDIGVDRYLGKPYQENELMRNVFALLESVRANG
jgi:chemosensory pili system protein ChpA (sensor histidine kinase/response regulator)